MYKNFFKRILDFALSLLGLPVLILILIVIGPIIYLQDKGSIFYNAPRLGKDGKIFKMYKLRSMKVNAADLRNEDGSTFNSEDDPRITKIGKFIRKMSIDETPQIINVLRGDMSFIGPRPDLPEALFIYNESEMKKLDIRPGITGYSQAYYRNSINTSSKFENDIYYVDNVCFILDVKILIKTVESVLLRKNIYIDREYKKENTNI